MRGMGRKKGAINVHRTTSHTSLHPHRKADRKGKTHLLNNHLQPVHPARPGILAPKSATPPSGTPAPHPALLWHQVTLRNLQLLVRDVAGDDEHLDAAEEWRGNGVPPSAPSPSADAHIVHLVHALDHVRVSVFVLEQRRGEVRLPARECVLDGGDNRGVAHHNCFVKTGSEQPAGVKVEEAKYGGERKSKVKR